MLYARQMHLSYRRATARRDYAESLTLDELLARLRRLGPKLGRGDAEALMRMLDRDPTLKKRVHGRDLAMLEAWRERADYGEFVEAEHPRADDGQFVEKGGGDVSGREKAVAKLAKSIAGKQTVTQPRAKKGGEVGANSEWYRAGAFIATQDLPKRIKDKIVKSAQGGVNVEPGKREVPEPGKMAIFDKLAGSVLNHRDNSINYNYLAYLQSTPAEVKMYETLVEKWKAGERWVDVDEFPQIANFTDAARLFVASKDIPQSLVAKLPDEWQEHLAKPPPQEDKPTADFFQPRGQQGSLFEPGRNVETGGFVGDVQPVKRAAAVYVPNAKPDVASVPDSELFKRTGEGFENLQLALGIKKPEMGPAGAEKVRAALAKHPGGKVIAALLNVDGSETRYDRDGYADRGGDIYNEAVDGKFTREELKAAADWMDKQYSVHTAAHRWVRGSVVTAKPKEGESLTHTRDSSPGVTLPKPKRQRAAKEDQPRLFALSMHDDWRVAYAEQTGKGQWITIGAKTGEDGKKHGGSPVFVEGGKITKGHPRLTGKRLGGAKGGSKPKAEPVESPAEGWPAFNRRVKLPAPKHGESWDGVVHHGTPRTLEGDTLNPGKERNTTDAGNLGLGVYLSPHHDIAKFYGQNRNVVSLKMSLDKPIVIEGDKNQGARDFAAKLGVKATPIYDGNKQTNDAWSKEFADKAKQAGYDGVIWSKGGNVEEVVSFDPVPFKKSSSGAKLQDEDRTDPDAKFRKGATERERNLAQNKAIAGRNRSEHAQSRSYNRAVWAKKARKEGIDADSLHQTAASILENDREFKSDVTSMLQEARKAHPHLQGVRQRAAKGIDSDAVKLIDDIADALSKRSEYRHIFPSDQDPQERLFDLLAAGNPEMMPEEDAYDQAFNLIMEHKAGQSSEPAWDDDPVPFAVEMYQSWEVATFYAEFDESKHPRADDGKFGSGGGKTKKGTPERKAKIAANKTTSQGGGLYQHGVEWSNKFRAIMLNLHQNPGHEKTEGWTNEVRDKLAEAYKRAVNQRLHTIREQVEKRFGVSATDSPHFKEFMRATAPNRTPFEDEFKAIAHDMAALALAHSKGLKDYRHGSERRRELRQMLNEHASKLSRASAQHADILDAAHKKLWAALSDSQPAGAGK